MDWRISLKKFAEGAAAGAVAAVSVLEITGQEKNLLAIFAGAAVVGAIRGGFNALKHARK
jgi:hypothetical protein